MYATERGINSFVNDQFIWNFWNSQSVDMLEGALGNIVRILTHGPIIRVKDTYSEANEYASSTVNIWANSLIHAGIPWYVVVLLVIPLLILMYLSTRNILSSKL